MVTDDVGHLVAVEGYTVFVFKLLFHAGKSRVPRCLPNFLRPAPVVLEGFLPHKVTE
jgi:hypothetical protein